MKYAKILALAATATGALMLIIGVGTASATVLCSTTGDPCPAGQDWPVGTVIDFSATKNAGLSDTAGQELFKCSTSTIKERITNTGGSTATMTSNVEEWTWGGCNLPLKTVKVAALEVHKIPGTSGGTVTSDGTFEFTYNMGVFGSCIYGITAGADIGTLVEGNPAKFHLNAVVEKLSGSNLACPLSDKLTGEYTVTSPAGTTLSVSSS